MSEIKQVCSKILEVLPSKQKEVILRRFGLSFFKDCTGYKTKKETLESIGKDFGVTRERVRQIEKDAFSKLGPESKKYQKVFQSFKNSIRKTGSLRREDRFLEELAENKCQNQVYFLLTLSEDFERIGETVDFYPLWTIDHKSWDLAQKAIKSVFENFKKTNQPLKIKELGRLVSLDPKILSFYLEVFKKIQENKEGFWGLEDWPEINPKRIKDKAYLTFKKAQKPLHFNEVAGLIDSALPQTVHNELIKDQRFVLVGRGIYALKEWGYEEGLVKDIISKILKQAGQPLKKEDVLEKTLKQRIIKENTVLLNLSNKKYFSRNSEGYYTTRED